MKWGYGFWIVAIPSNNSICLFLTAFSSFLIRLLYRSAVQQRVWKNAYRPTHTAPSKQFGLQLGYWFWLIWHKSAMSISSYKFVCLFSLRHPLYFTQKAEQLNQYYCNKAKDTNWHETDMIPFWVVWLQPNKLLKRDKTEIKFKHRS